MRLKFILFTLLILILPSTLWAKAQKVGFPFPLSGDVAAYGEECTNGIKLALEEINSEAQVIDPVFADNEGKPEKTISVVKKFIELDNVVAIVGPLISTTTLAAAKVAEESEVPLMTPTATNDRITDKGEFISRICFIDSFQGYVMAKFAAENLGKKKAGLLIHHGNDYSEGLAKTYRQVFQKLGGEIVFEDHYRSSDSDYSVVIEKVKNSGCEVLFIPGYYKEVGPMIKQAHTSWQGIILEGGDGWDSPDLFKLGIFSGIEAYISSHFSPEDSSEDVQDFVKRYKETYQKRPGAMAALGYDAVKIMADCIQKSKGDPDALLSNINNLKGYQGITGSISLDENRNAVKDAVVQRVTASGFKFEARIQGGSA